MNSTVTENEVSVKNNVKKTYTIKFEVLLDDDIRKVNVVYAPEEKEALALRAKEVGRIEEQLIGWKEKHTLVHGYTHYDIAKECHLAYDIQWESFATKQDALADAVERKLLLPSLTLFSKIEAARQFGEYWQGKLDRRHPVCVAAAQKNKGVLDVLGIVGIKAGASRSTVNKVNRILDSNDDALIAQCRKGEISISNAYEMVNGSDDKQKEVSGKNVFAAEKEKFAKRKSKELNALAKYMVDGFKNKEKLDAHGLKFFVLRWNEENPDNKIKDAEIQKAINSFGTEK